LLFHRFSNWQLNIVNPTAAGAASEASVRDLMWGLYRCRVTPQPPKLYIFPHAGGSAEFYVPFAKAFASDIKRVAVRYPGRGGNHDLGSFTTIGDLADKVCQMIKPPEDADEKIAFFGHSMGGLLAFEVARRFEQAGSPIAALFVSAVAAPGHVGYEHIPESDRGLLDAVSEMTGVNPEFLENEEFAASILPTLRGLKAISKYDCPPGEKLSCPISAFLGDDDEVATPEKVQPWVERTTSEFTMRVFPGHHFYLTEHIAELVGEIEPQILSACAG
jgi:surfactin synthase thioesterase subunit